MGNPAGKLSDCLHLLRLEKLLFKLLALGDIYPDAEQTSVFLPALPPWPLGREQRQICVKIDEMRKQGWTYLRSSRVKDGRLTLRGVTLHFIRTDGFKPRPAA